MKSTYATDESVAVVGAGPGGLASAVLLASRGLDVTVYEAAERIGGRTTQLAAGPYRFDMGPTFFLMPHVLQEIFQAAGADLFERVPMHRLDPMYRLVIGQPNGPDIQLDATQDLDEMSRRIAEIHAPDGEAFRRFHAANKAKLDAAEPILRRPIRSMFDLVRPDAVRALRHLQLTSSVQDLNEKYFQHPAIQRAVGFQSKYLGMSPYDCPSLFTILPYIEYAYGVWHPIGGCHALMQGLSDLLIEHGGRIETGTPVEALVFDGDEPGANVTGVELGGKGQGRTVQHKQVVVNADATWALKHLIPASMRRRETDQAVDRKAYSCSTFMMYLGVEGEVGLPHHTIRVAPEYEQNLQDIGRDGGASGTLTEDASFYICNPSVTDPSLAPDGHSSLYMLLPTPNTKSGIDWKAETPRLRERVLDLTHRVHGIDLRPRIREEIIIAPDDWAAKRINHGATFNLAHSLNQMLHRRPLHRSPHARGLYFVGGGTHPGSGLPVIFLSSQITAQLVIDDAGTMPSRPASRTKQAEPQEVPLG